ncbi:MAG: hypothetical protein ACKON9_25140, partial [Planctomycetaceae bacterium]
MLLKPQTIVGGLVLLCCAWLTSPAWAQTTPDRTFFEYAGRPGTVAAVGGGEMPAEIAAAVAKTAGDNGTVVILPDAAED